jgi:hypothetical protein
VTFELCASFNITDSFCSSNQSKTWMITWHKNAIVIKSVVDFVSQCWPVLVQVLTLIIRNMNIEILGAILDFGKVQWIKKVCFVPFLTGVGEASKIGNNCPIRDVNLGKKSFAYNYRKICISISFFECNRSKTIL